MDEEHSSGIINEEHSNSIISGEISIIVKYENGIQIPMTICGSRGSEQNNFHYLPNGDILIFPYSRNKRWNFNSLKEQTDSVKQNVFFSQKMTALGIMNFNARHVTFNIIGDETEYHTQVIDGFQQLAEKGIYINSTIDKNISNWTFNIFENKEQFKDIRIWERIMADFIHDAIILSYIDRGFDRSIDWAFIKSETLSDKSGTSYIVKPFYYNRYVGQEGCQFKHHGFGSSKTTLRNIILRGVENVLFCELENRDYSQTGRKQEIMSLSRGQTKLVKKVTDVLMSAADCYFNIRKGWFTYLIDQLDPEYQKRKEIKYQEKEKVKRQNEQYRKLLLEQGYSTSFVSKTLTE